MGTCASRPAPVFDGDDLDDDDEEKVTKRKDTRKRNSHIFALMGFIDQTINRPISPETNEQDPINWETIACTSAAALKFKKTDWNSMDPRAARSNKIADNAAMGNMRTIREQVIAHFTIINRPYSSHWEGECLLHIVCREGYYAMVEFMFNPKNRSIFDTTSLVIDVENANYRTPLLLAFTPPSGTYCAGRFGGLMDNGGPFHERPEEIQIDSDWIRPGKVKDRKDIIKLLVNEGANVNKLDFHDYSPLHFAVIWGWVDVCEFLVAKGAEINAIDVIGDNSLHIACRQNHLDVVEYLVEHTGISVNARNSEGDTPLFIACMQENVEICECLMSYEAEVNAVNYAKKTPLKLSCAKQNIPLTHMLLDFKAQRRKSALDLLQGDAEYTITKRLEKDDKEAKEAALKQSTLHKSSASGPTASAYGAWVPYLDKLKGELFYYNKVSWESQWEVPVDYFQDKTYVVTKRTYGMHFYH